MLSILKSCKPKILARIFNDNATLLIVNKFPKNYKGWVYLYCTKEEYLLRTNKGYIASKKGIAVGGDSDYTFAYSDEGTVVARFWCDKVEEIECLEDSYMTDNGMEYECYYESENYVSCENPYWENKKKLLEAEGCLGSEELDDYLKFKNGYAVHISNLEIFDKPKELSEFKYYKKTKCYVCKRISGLVYCTTAYDNFSTGCNKPLTKAPQSWSYVEVDECTK